LLERGKRVRIFLIASAFGLAAFSLVLLVVAWVRRAKFFVRGWIARRHIAVVAPPEVRREIDFHRKAG
jgi:hypothetical protein